MKVAVREGDQLDVSATYDTRKASWYESMGVIVVWYADGVRGAAKDPFAKRIDWRGKLARGHLPETTATAASRAQACATRARWPTARSPTP